MPFDPVANEIVLVSSVEQLRRLPAHTLEVTLLAIDADNARELARYTFNHVPWQRSPEQ